MSGTEAIQQNTEKGVMTFYLPTLSHLEFYLNSVEVDYGFYGGKERFLKMISIYHNKVRSEMLKK